MTDPMELADRLDAHMGKADMAEVLADCRRAAACIREMVEWRPIETAPMDGAEIIIYREGWVSAPRAKWGDHEGEDEDGREITFGGWFLASEWDCPGVEDGFIGWNEDIEGGCMPTHWLPLPPAPGAEDE